MFNITKNNKLINKKIAIEHMVLAYIICKDNKEAERISMLLLKKRLIACANIFPVKSLYWWKGKILKHAESVLIAKSSRKKYKKLEREVKKIHSYEVPCILNINAIPNIEYGRWAQKELR